ncbi:MAG: sulfotransferase [Pseudomonadales bacterium]
MSSVKPVDPNNSNSPAWVRKTNKLGHDLGLTKRVLAKKLHPDFILDQANYELGSSPELEARVSRLLESIQLESLSLIGGVALSQLLTDSVRNQLAYGYARTRSDIAELRKIKKPVFIVGFPRTGTTFLHNLLASDPQFCAPRMWELHAPALSSSGREKKRRLREVRRFARASNLLAPEMKKIHPVNADSYEECLKLLENTLLSPTFLMYAEAPKYKAWLLKNLDSNTIAEVYEDHKYQLQLLAKHHNKTGRWVLKSPAHALFLQGLLQTYPDALLVNTVRDPVDSIVSFCSLTHTVRSMMCESPDLAEIGKFGVEFFSEAYRVNEIVSLKNPGSMINISFESLTKYPIETCRQLYEVMKLEWDKSIEKGMLDWLATRPSNSNIDREHGYSARQYSLSESELSNRFCEYDRARHKLKALGVSKGFLGHNL